MRVTIEDLEIAKMWLESYESEGDDGDSIRKVVGWMQSEIDRRKIGSVARAHSISASMAREAIKRAEEKRC